MIFKYIDNTYYKLDVYKKYNSMVHNMNLVIFQIMFLELMTWDY